MKKDNEMFPAKMKGRLVREWGTAAGSVLPIVVEKFRDRGFDGPFSLSERNFMSFHMQRTDSIRLCGSISTGGEDASGNVRFHVGLIFLSSDIYKNSIESDPWFPSFKNETDKWFCGYVPCLTMSLAHFKWVDSPTTAKLAFRHDSLRTA